MADEVRPTVRARRLASELRRLREAAGKSTGQAAEALDCSSSKISRIETGANGVRSVDLDILLNLYGLEGKAQREALKRLSQESKERGWWHAYGGAIAPEYSDLLGLEWDAESIRTWQHAVVPGLLQTPDYVRALLRADPVAVSGSELEELVGIRMERQGLLGREKAPRYSAVVWEPALRCAVGGSGVLGAQLDRLLEAAERPNVSLRVVPLSAGAHAGTGGAFTMFGFADSPHVGAVFLETLTSSHYVDREAELGRYTAVFDRLCSSALNPADSLELIARIKKDL
jgi:transcriptional regulator with XRE-family HTH domain